MNVVAKIFLLLSAISGTVVVVLGALGAHWLSACTQGTCFAYQTAINYQMFHTLALMALSVLMYYSAALHALWPTGALWLLGILLFCGNLYLLALGTPHLGWLTPIGGLSLISGWLYLCYGAVRLMKKSNNE